MSLNLTRPLAFFDIESIGIDASKDKIIDLSNRKLYPLNHKVAELEGKSITIEKLLNKSSNDIKDIFEALRAFILSLGDYIQLKELKFYYAFKKIRNFVSVVIHPQNISIVLFLSLYPTPIILIDVYTRDVSKIGHLGTGNLELNNKI